MVFSVFEIHAGKGKLLELKFVDENSLNKSLKLLI